jgi:hypothetical protein
MWVYRNGQSLGYFEESIVENNLRNGSFLPTDVGCREGESQWQPLYILFPQVIPPYTYPTQIGSKGNMKRIVLPIIGGILLIISIVLLVYGGMANSESQRPDFGRGADMRAREASFVGVVSNSIGYATGAVGLILITVGLLQKRPNR